jgi:hypothetical protein
MSRDSDKGDASDFLDQLASEAEDNDRPASDAPTEPPKPDEAGDSPSSPDAAPADRDGEPAGEAGWASESSGSHAALPEAELAGEPQAGPTEPRHRDPAESAPARSRGAASARTAARRGGARRSSRKGGNTELKRLAIPALLIVAGLMLIPGLWALGVLGGVAVWQSNKAGAQTVAGAMLLCWPIAAFLVFGAWYYYRELQNAPQSSRGRSQSRQGRRA